VSIKVCENRRFVRLFSRKIFPGGRNKGAKQHGETNRKGLKALAKTQGRHRDGDSALYLWVRSPSARYWTYRYRLNGRQTELGLGPYDEVTLDAARALYAEKSALVLKKIDPIADKRARRLAKAPEATSAPTFGEIVDRYVESHRDEWRSSRHLHQWVATTGPGSYCEPIRRVPIDRLTTAVIHDLLEPIWKRAPETGSRVRGRIEAAWGFAQARGHIASDCANPARWKGHLQRLLAKRPKTVHLAAMPYAEVPAFMGRLAKRADGAAPALAFLILTAARTGEVRWMTWDEVDLNAKVWTVPKSKMKGKREHKVPLSGPAIEILRAQLAGRRDGDLYCFPGHRPGKPTYDTALTTLIERMRATTRIDGKDVAITAHGFRSAFRDFAGDETDFSRDVAEAALAHLVGDKAEQAYRRGSAFDTRRRLMDAWARYCVGEPGTNVVAFQTRAS
jgi:integrase